MPPGPPGRATRRAGWWDALIGPGARHRHRPLLRGLPQRARRVPGDDRTVVDRARRPPVGRTLPPDHHPRPGGRRGAAGRPPGHRPVGRRGRRIRWAGCGSSSGASGTPTGWPGRRCSPSGRRPPRRRSPCARVQCRGRPPRPRLPRRRLLRLRAGRPLTGMALARGIGQISYRTGRSSADRFGRRPQDGGGPAQRRPVRRRVVPRPPGREAGPALRPELRIWC